MPHIKTLCIISSFIFWSILKKNYKKKYKKLKNIQNQYNIIDLLNLLTSH